MHTLHENECTKADILTFRKIVPVDQHIAKFMLNCIVSKIPQTIHNLKAFSSVKHKYLQCPGFLGNCESRNAGTWNGMWNGSNVASYRKL